MRSIRLLVAAAGVIGLSAGCGPSYCDYYYDPYCGYYAPVDYVGVGIDPYGYCADPTFCGCVDPSVCLTERTTTALATGPAPTACSANDAACELPPLATSVNEALQSVLGPVDALLSASAQRNGGITTFGPIDAGPPASHGSPAATFRLSVQKNSDGSSWKLEARPVGTTSSWVQVFTGSMVSDGHSRRGHGVLGVDLDALAGVNATAYPGGGRVLGAFANDDVQKATAYRLVGFHEPTVSATDATLTSSTTPGGDVDTTLATAGSAPVRTAGTVTPMSTNGASAASSAPLDPGAPPEAMPDPGF